MTRKPTSAFLLALALAVGFASCGPEYDLIIRGGSVIDGTGSPARRADVGVKGDRIDRIGDLTGKRAAKEIDASGLAVTPGFIDVQGQSGNSLLVDGNGESHIRQGITSEIIGEGSTPALWRQDQTPPDRLRATGVGPQMPGQPAPDWNSFDGYLRTLERRGTSINVGSFVPIAMVRGEVVGLDNRPPTADELARMEAIVDGAMREGAFGLATALIYPPASFASTGEIIALATVAARYGGVYITHVRGESFRVKEAIREAISIGEQAKLPVVIYHLKVAARPLWGTMGEVGKIVDEARARGLNVSACQYPYTAGGTGLAASLPGWVQEGGRERMLERLRDLSLRPKIRDEIQTKLPGEGFDGAENLVAGSTFEGIQIASVPQDRDQSVVGKRVSQIASERNEDPWETYFKLLVDNDGRVGALYHMMSEEDVRTAMVFPWVSIGTDAAAIKPDGELGRGQPHPRSYGTFPRILGRYVRDAKLLPLEEAIRKMSGLAAAQLQIRERGELRPGWFADVVIFDPATVIDHATFERPHQYSTGVRHVIVNGIVTVENEQHTGARAGRGLYGPGYRRGT
ncbi:MAG: N-acyl-D-amino-acid deacylase family protein [Vicinamibacterales bacterium]